MQQRCLSNLGNESMEFHYVYKITRVHPDMPEMYYIGKRTCRCPIEEDLYMGSSKVLNADMEKVGSEHFKKEVLEIFESEEAAYAKEIELHALYDVKSDDTYYNLVNQLSEKFNNSELWKNPKFRETISSTMSNTAVALWKNKKYREKKSEEFSKTTKKLWEDPIFRERKLEENKLRWENPGYRQMMTDNAKKMWEDPEFRKSVSKYSSEAAKLRWSDPEYREKMIDVIKRNWKDPEFKQRKLEACKLRWKDPKYKQKMSEKAIKQWEDPEFRQMRSRKAAEHAAGKNNPSYRSDIVDEDIQAMRAKGKTIVQIAKELKCTESTIHRRIQKYSQPPSL